MLCKEFIREEDLCNLVLISVKPRSLKQPMLMTADCYRPDIRACAATNVLDEFSSIHFFAFNGKPYQLT